MITIKSAEIESRDIHRMIDEIYADKLLIAKCMRISMRDRNKHLFDVAYEVCRHIADTGTDYTYGAEVLES